MAKKVNNPFLEDFQQISKTAESAVKLVREKESETAAKASYKESNQDLTKSEKETKPKEKPTKRKSSDSKSRLDSKQEVPKPRGRGEPLAAFNTRIPMGHSELLDDLVYQLKKKGTHDCKQDLAFEAVEDLLKKYDMF